MNRILHLSRAWFGPLAAVFVAIPGVSAAITDIIVTNDLVLEGGARLSARLIIRASHVTVDGNGAVLAGPGQIGDAKSLENAGIGVLIESVTGVTLKNIRVHGFATGLVIRQARAVLVADSDFSDNYHNPAHGWGEMPTRGGILCENVRQSVFRSNRANRVWDGIHFIDSDENLVENNDFSRCSNTAAKLWKSSRNRFLSNNLSYGIRIDRAAGEVHARDSTCVLIETGSNDNYWSWNDITHGGDGIFIRPLNRWVSTGNVFVDNDTSYANNNCVESWSPGNMFIRNKANHGSYGFWLGGSDHTVLIGNEAAFNGLASGNHNAPEPGFRHGGIVIVSGSSSHTIVEGNHVHDNNGAGIVFRGDVESQGRKWRTEHWIIQQNRIENNRFGIWGRWGDGILLAANVFAGNEEGNFITNVSNLVELKGSPEIRTAPEARLLGPATARVGETVRLDGTLSRDLGGQPLSYRWWLHGEAGREGVFERTFDQPGFYRIGLTVDNGALAALAWRDLIVTSPVANELGTEGQAANWGFELENNDGSGRVLFRDDPEAIIGNRCLHFTPDPYPGAFATAVFPKDRQARWDFSGRRQISFWVKAQNPNIPGYQNAGPVVRFLTSAGQIELKPAKDGNLLNDPPFSEARWTWMPVVIPLAGDDAWQRTVTGDISLDRIDALSVSLDSWGGDPFEVWLDGLTVE